MNWPWELKKIVMNKWFLKLTVFFLIDLIVLNGFCQKKENKLNDEQYLVLEYLFTSGNSEDVLLLNSTIDFKTWIELIDLKFKQNAIPCFQNNNPILGDYNELKNKFRTISIKFLEQNRMSSGVKLTNELLFRGLDGNWYPTRAISEPIIVGDYAYVFNKQFNEESLIILKKENDEGWVFNCFVEFYLVLND